MQQPSDAPAIVLAKSVAASDVSTSTLLTDLTGPRIRLGAAALDTHSDVVYSAPTGPDGQPRPLLLDIQVPRSAGRKPLVVYVTGGGFVFAEKSNGLTLRSYLAEAGFVVASIQYRTVLDGATFTDGVSDVKAAIRYLRAHGDQYGIDPERVGVWGESAGGYLVSMVGATTGLPQFEAGEHLEQSSAVLAVVDKFGLSDLAAVAADFDPATQEHWNQPDTPLARYAGAGPGVAPRDAPRVNARANPISYLDGGEPPFLILHGNADTIISPSQSLLLHTALRAAGASSTRYVLDGANHGDLEFLGDPDAGLPWSTEAVMDLIVGFLRDQLT